MKVKTIDADVGVLIGRFQVPDLHDGHKELIDTVVAKHQRVMMFICSTPGVLVTRKNPLDYFTRMLMIQEAYPNIVILPLHDAPSDEEWSRSVDSKIVETFGDHASAVLYGSRDAFIPHYSGMFPTVELAESFDVSGTQVRLAASKEVRQHPEFRKGVVYAAHNKHPVTFPTVDMAVIKSGVDGNSTPRQIALGRKKNDLPGKWRFPGGFVDPNRDKSLEHAAERELREEFGMSLNFTPMEYAGSTKVNDWRYRNEVDQVITSVFVTHYLWGPLIAGDDINEVKWFDFEDFDKDILVAEHQQVMDIVITHLNKE